MLFLKKKRKKVRFCTYPSHRLSKPRQWNVKIWISQMHLAKQNYGVGLYALAQGVHSNLQRAKIMLFGVSSCVIGFLFCQQSRIKKKGPLARIRQAEARPTPEIRMKFRFVGYLTFNTATRDISMGSNCRTLMARPVLV